jgi:hypothetical protein
MAHRQGPEVASNGYCTLCKGTHYGTRDCPYSCTLCDVNTESCSRDWCPRNERWATEDAAELRRINPAEAEYASWQHASGVEVRYEGHTEAELVAMAREHGSYDTIMPDGEHLRTWTGERTTEALTRTAKAVIAAHERWKASAGVSASDGQPKRG